MRYALLFPGQGSQYAGMGRSLADAHPAARERFAAADDILGAPLSRICFEGPEDALALTENTQPAILTMSIATLDVLRAEGLPEPAAAAGHSLGEYSAHVAAGTLDFAEALRTVRARGRFMQEAVPVGVGAMAAILGLEADTVDALCREAAGDEVVSPANLNGPGQVVIAGHAGAVDRASRLASERGAKKVVPLPVSAPFHCALMNPAARRLVAVLEAARFEDPGFPVYTNVDARAVHTAGAARDALARQVAAPVRWVELVRAMREDGVDTTVEVGPGRVLSGLVRRIARDVRAFAASDPESVSEVVREIGGNR